MFPTVFSQVVIDVPQCCASITSLGLSLLHLFLGALDFVSVFKALIPGEERRKRRKEGGRRKEGRKGGGKRVCLGSYVMAVRTY